MKRDMRQEILSAARELFDLHGYNNVSMRNIAEVLQISVGNLTYHFKRKEELVEAVVIDQHRNYKKPSIPRNLEELNRIFWNILHHHSNNPYYFRHYTQLAQLCPKVYEIQIGVMQDLYDLITETFHQFEKQGLVQKESACYRKGVVQSVMSVCIYGIPYIKCSEGRNEQEETGSCLWDMVCLILTAEGKNKFSELRAASAVYKD